MHPPGSMPHAAGWPAKLARAYRACPRAVHAATSPLPGATPALQLCKLLRYEHQQLPSRSVSRHSVRQRSAARQRTTFQASPHDTAAYTCSHGTVGRPTLPCAYLGRRPMHSGAPLARPSARPTPCCAYRCFWPTAQALGRAPRTPFCLPYATLRIPLLSAAGPSTRAHPSHTPSALPTPRCAARSWPRVQTLGCAAGSRDTAQRRARAAAQAPSRSRSRWCGHTVRTR
mmetsp:Transcript_13237/g.38475  ORF Transcript_13237/g.38475 Transcript_13237/m.38475 type:complete len:229 (+) Transcript_13237:445-1131(+)